MSAILMAPREGISYLKHQEVGVRWMMAREEAGAAVCRGGILGDDMGLGKTFQTIGLLKNGLALRTLIICPPALIAGWTDELKECGYTVAVLVGGTATWSAPDGASVTDTVKPGATPSRLPAVAGTVWLTSYPKACLYRKYIATAEPAFERVVLDEGHIIRNGKTTSRWMNCMAIAKRALCRWILSATPVQNGPSDWRNLCWWLRVRCPSAMIPELAPTLMLRRTMEELRGVEGLESLPPPPRFVEHNLSIPEGTAEGKLFRVLCDQMDRLLQQPPTSWAADHAVENKSMSALIKLELWMRIQQFMVHPQIYIEAMRAKLGGAYPRPDWKSPAEGGTSTKWTECMKELAAGVDAAEGVIVFCNFKREMDMVEEAAVAMGASVFAIRGGLGVEKVGEAVKGARTAAAEGKAVVVVVQIVSGGAGLNLQFCKRILFLSQHWNPAVVHQAVGRAVRIGQRAVVAIHLFRVVDDVCDNIDRRMFDLHVRKIGGAQEICGSLYEGFHVGTGTG
jgi:SNF2 family DNA or RNA helicase